MSRLPSATVLTLLACLGLTWPAGASAPAPPPAERPLAGVSPCALVEGLPGPLDPIRRVPALAPALRALDLARDPAAFRRAHARLVTPIARLLAEAAVIFHPAGEGAVVDPDRAQRFLSRHVLAKDGLLRVGDESFEPRPELAAALAWAACRADLRADALATARRPRGPDGAPLRAFAALLLLEQGERAAAADLAPDLTHEGFLGPYVLAELATDPAERQALHALARRHLVTPDQHTALREQALRFEATPR